MGLELIRKAVALEPEPELRAQLRDEAVKFLVLRDVETRPELATGRAHGLVFGRSGHRLAVLSEDDEELAFWNVERQPAAGDVVAPRPARAPRLALPSRP